jgi:hypothetical protein
VKPIHKSFIIQASLEVVVNSVLGFIIANPLIKQIDSEMINLKHTIFFASSPLLFLDEL